MYTNLGNAEKLFFAKGRNMIGSVFTVDERGWYTNGRGPCSLTSPTLVPAIDYKLGLAATFVGMVEWLFSAAYYSRMTSSRACRRST